MIPTKTGAAEAAGGRLVGLGEGGEHHDRGEVLLADLLRGGDAVGLRHLDVEDDEVVMLLAGLGEALGAGARRGDRNALRGHALGDERGDALLVLRESLAQAREQQLGAEDGTGDADGDGFFYARLRRTAA